MVSLNIRKNKKQKANSPSAFYRVQLDYPVKINKRHFPFRLKELSDQ